MPKSRGAVKKNKTKVVKQKKKKTKGRLLTTLLVRKADACACAPRSLQCAPGAKGARARS